MLNFKSMILRKKLRRKFMNLFFMEEYFKIG